MNKKIPEDRLDQIIKSTDIVKLIGQTDPPMKDGRYICPWCHDTCAFEVSTRFQTYHCFCCGAGGDAIRWIVEKHGIGFHRAVEFLEANNQAQRI